MRKPRPGLILNLFLKASRVQKKRAVLTIASIAWGSLSLLLLLAFGEGLSLSIAKGMNGMAQQPCSHMARHHQHSSGRVCRQGAPSGRLSMTSPLLRERLPNLQEVSGEIHRRGVIVNYGDTTTTAQVKGVTHGFGEIRNHIPRSGGRFLDTMDENQRRRVAFIGNELAEKIFGKEDPVGKGILLDRVPYTIIGVMMPKVTMGNYNGMDKDQDRHPDYHI